MRCRIHLLAWMGVLLPIAACSVAAAREPLFRPQVVVRSAQPPIVATNIQTQVSDVQPAVQPSPLIPAEPAAKSSEPRLASVPKHSLRPVLPNTVLQDDMLPQRSANADANDGENDVPPPPPNAGPLNQPKSLPAERPSVAASEELPATERTTSQEPPLPEEVPLGSVSTSIGPKSGKLPPNPALKWAEKGADEGYLFAQVDVVYYWDAPNFCYQPLYFEEPNLERLGYSRCPLLQPATSGIHFMASTLALPYQMTLHPYRRDCIYPLGHYRPGSPVPYRRILPEWNAKAAAVQAAATTGLIFVLP